MKNDNFYLQIILTDRNPLHKEANYDLNLDCVIFVNTKPIGAVKDVKVYQSLKFCKHFAIKLSFRFLFL